MLVSHGRVADTSVRESASMMRNMYQEQVRASSMTGGTRVAVGGVSSPSPPPSSSSSSSPMRVSSSPLAGQPTQRTFYQQQQQQQHQQQQQQRRGSVSTTRPLATRTTTAPYPLPSQQGANARRNSTLGMSAQFQRSPQQQQQWTNARMPAYHTTGTGRSANAYAHAHVGAHDSRRDAPVTASKAAMPQQPPPTNATAATTTATTTAAAVPAKPPPPVYDQALVEEDIKREESYLRERAIFWHRRLEGVWPGSLAPVPGRHKHLVVPVIPRFPPRRK